MVLVSHVRFALCSAIAFISCTTCRAIADQPTIICNTFVSTWLQVPEGGQTAWRAPSGLPGPPGPAGPPGPPGYQTTVSRPATPNPSPIPTKAALGVTAGQPFFFSLVGFLESPNSLVNAISTNPIVNWIQLDRVGKSISGQVPINYPVGPVTLIITTQYNIGGRDINKRDFETQFAIILNVFLPASPSTPGSLSLSKALPTVSQESPTRSLPPINTPGQIPPSTTPVVSSTFSTHLSPANPSTTTPTSGVPAPTLTTTINLSSTTIGLSSTETDLSSTTTTTAPSTTRTRPTAVPTPTIYQGQSFAIGKDSYELNEGDILNGVSSDPPTNWIRLSFSQTFRPCCIVGVVPVDWSPGPINVTLDMYSRFTTPSFAYFTSFIVIVMESPPVSTTSAI